MFVLKSYVILSVSHNYRYVSVSVPAKVQTITVSRAGSSSTWTFTFSGFTQIKAVVVKYTANQYTNINNSVYPPSGSSWSISGNTASYTHGTDSLTWTCYATAIGI